MSVSAPGGDLPPLTASELVRLRAVADLVDVAAGDVLYAAGDSGYDFVLVETGEIEIVREARAGSPEQVVARHGPGRFLGELNMITGQAAYLTARVAAGGRIWKVPRDRFRRLMSEDPELSDLVLRTFMARREFLRTGEGARSVEILGGRTSAAVATVQTQKFGARITSPCEASSLAAADGQLAVILADGTEVAAHAVIVATGALYRTLPIDRWAAFEGAGIYYAATELEARACNGSDVIVVGGANSAGQAALFLAGRAGHVRLVVRAADLAAGMSAYLAERIHADPRIEVRTATEVCALGGGSSLEEVTLIDRSSGAQSSMACQGLFCFIGAVPSTHWLGCVAHDDDGFVLTDHDLPDDALDAFSLLGRRPFPFETSLPSVFAVGDVRHGSMKRVAAAVGEGSSAVRSVHQALGT
jgi:thioredoxin reductase